MNSNISSLYIVYQFILLISTILGPATIILAIASAFKSVFHWELWECYFASLAPVVFYLIICFKCKTKTQLLVGAFLSVMYAAVMTVVLVGIIQAIVLESVLNPSLLFLVVVAICFVFAGLIHPYEFSVLIHGILYFLCIPAGYLVLMIYSLCNLNNVSWGTRDMPKRKAKAQQDAEAAAEATKHTLKKQGGWFSFLKIDAFVEKLQDTLTQLHKNRENTYHKEVVEMLKSVDKSMKEMVKQQKKSNGQCKDSWDKSDDDNTKPKIKQDEKSAKQKPQPRSDNTHDQDKPDNTENPDWIKDPRLRTEKTESLLKDEKKFWNDLINLYLKPLDKDTAKQENMARKLKTLRNNSAFGFWFVNFLWILFNYMIQRNSNLSTIQVGALITEPIGFVFLIFFLLVLVLQMAGMIFHRGGTLLQLISTTVISDMYFFKAIEQIKNYVQVLMPTPREQHQGNKQKEEQTGKDQRNHQDNHEDNHQHQGNKQKEEQSGKDQRNHNVHRETLRTNLQKGLKLLKEEHKGNSSEASAEERYKSETDILDYRNVYPKLLNPGKGRPQWYVPKRLPRAYWPKRRLPGATYCEYYRVHLRPIRNGNRWQSQTH